MSPGRKLSTRSELNGCGDAARISEQLRSLRRAGAILDRAETIVLLEPAKHLDLLDLLDRIAGNLHMHAFQEARERLFNPLARSSEGQRYALRARARHAQARVPMRARPTTTPGPPTNEAAPAPEPPKWRSTALRHIVRRPGVMSLKPC